MDRSAQDELTELTRNLGSAYRGVLALRARLRHDPQDPIAALGDLRVARWEAQLSEVLNDVVDAGPLIRLIRRPPAD